MRRTTRLGLALALALAAALAARARRAPEARLPVRPVASRDGPTIQRVVPESVRVRVVVLNTTPVRGVGRRFALYLRDAGFDVVRYAGEGPAQDSTVILDHAGRADWVRWAREALGEGVVVRPAPRSGDVDLTVRLGRLARTPPEAFYP